MCSHIVSSAVVTMTERENAGDEECMRNLLRTPARSASDDKGPESECMESPTPLESNMQQIQLFATRHVSFVPGSTARQQAHGGRLAPHSTSMLCNGHCAPDGVWGERNSVKYIVECSSRSWETVT